MDCDGSSWRVDKSFWCDWRQLAEADKGLVGGVTNRWLTPAHSNLCEPLSLCECVCVCGLHTSKQLEWQLSCIIFSFFLCFGSTVCHSIWLWIFHYALLTTMQITNCRCSQRPATPTKYNANKPQNGEAAGNRQQATSCMQKFCLLKKFVLFFFLKPKTFVIILCRSLEPFLRGQTFQ